MVKSSDLELGHPLFTMCPGSMQSKLHEGRQLCSIHSYLPRALNSAWIIKYFLNIY